MSNRLEEATSGTRKGRGILHIFEGRASRREYWLWCGPLIPIVTVLSLFAGLLGTILSIALLVPTIRRLHDLGRSGWWIAGFNVSTNVMAMIAIAFPGPFGIAMALLSIVLYLGGLIALGCVPGQPHANAYGPPATRKENVAETFS